MPGNKSNFQPKDARAVSILYSDEDEDDISELFPHDKPKRMMTGTQALVEFLKTTSPEEFQRSNNAPSEHNKSMNNLFAKIRRGPKKQQQQQHASPPVPTTSASSMSTRSTASLPVHHYHHQNNTSSFSDSSASTITATNGHHWMHSTTGSEISSHTIHRKNYIEIVPQPNPVVNAAITTRNPRSPSSYDTTSIQSFVLRNNNNNTATTTATTANLSNANQNAGEPILPNKKRESSLYSGSLRYSVSVRSQLSTATSSNNNAIYNPNNGSSTSSSAGGNPNHHRRQLSHQQQQQRLESKATEDYLIAADGLDTIEAALLQRLERIRLANADIPSEQVAAGLAAEHIRALGITHDLEYQHQQHSEKRKVRHMQVQTETSYGITNKETEQSAKEEADVKATNHDASTTDTATDKDSDNLNAELRARRAEAALENALDNFEVISGLAYKKLRELWEEKMRWENACMELRDRLLMMEQQQQQQRRLLKQTHQQQQQPVDVNEHLHNEYFLEENEALEEEEDGLGLSEFPCDEEEDT